MAPAEDYLSEIIRLQLKKPKHWNWELSTSKSSPHIALPTIQLLNSRGKLLIEAKDNGSLERQTWHSSQTFPNNNTNTTKSNSYYSPTLSPKSSYTNNIQRCQSDHLERRIQNSLSRIRNTLEKCQINVSTTKLQKSQSASLVGKNNSNFNPIMRNNEREIAKTKPICAGENEHRGRKLQKSRSAYLSVPSETHYPLEHNFSSTDVPKKEKRYRKHKRSQSDDNIRRKLKFNSEESLKRAQIDGYRNLITPYTIKKSISNIYIPKIDEKDEVTNNKKPERVLQKFNAETIELEKSKPKSIEVRDLDHKIYYIRESRAGALVVCETFNKNHRRRSSSATNSSMMSQSVDDARKNVRPNTLDLCSKKYNTFQNKYNKADDNSNYIVQEPTTTPLTDRKFSIIEDIFENANKFQNESFDMSEKGCLIQQLSTTSEEKFDNSLSVIENMLEDVDNKLKEIKKCDNAQTYARPALATPTATATAPMGANVSRHSSKGLSGRRSRSSGSICGGGAGGGAGRGRCNSGAASEGSADAKVCSSLPSYLDEGGGAGGGTGGVADGREAERVPPLGGAACAGAGVPLHWKFSDGGSGAADQGYGSERSPEEEYAGMGMGIGMGMGGVEGERHLEPHACFPFVTPESTFVVRVNKGPRGLGLSVCGGADSNGSWPGLVRIKRLFPGQPAASCNRLKVGDVLLHANGVALTGLTSYEALEVLRTAPTSVTLQVCRPPPDVLNCVSPVSEAPPPPPRREPPPGALLLHDDAHGHGCFGSPSDDCYHGEFEVTLAKIQGSLGFTLRKEDDSALGHYVRALVREPALTDGRIKPGDKILSVNDVEISAMSHEAAVQFLRGAGERVRLRLYRDAAQTPVATLSPTETSPSSSFHKKTHLRQEAVDMLNDIATRKSNGTLVSHEPVGLRRSLSPNTSPKKLQQHMRHQSEDPSTKYLLPEEHFHEALLHGYHHHEEDPFTSLFSMEDDDDDRPSRPSSLDLYNPNQTPVAARKPRFNFSLAHNAYELNNLDAEVLDAPNLTYNPEDAHSAELETSKEPVSMPPMQQREENFVHRQPAYQSAHIALEDRNKVDENNMKKWKNVVIQPQENRAPSKPVRSEKIVERKKSVRPMKDDYEILAIELNRGWNSRLGFSLQGAAGVTYVSAVHADSVAARDGRIKPGDVVIKVNDEGVEHLTTNEIIDLLRIVRGPVCIVVKRRRDHDDCHIVNRSNVGN